MRKKRGYVLIQLLYKITDNWMYKSNINKLTVQIDAIVQTWHFGKICTSARLVLWSQPYP